MVLEQTECANITESPKASLANPFFATFLEPYYEQKPNIRQLGDRIPNGQELIIVVKGISIRYINY